MNIWESLVNIYVKYLVYWNIQYTVVKELATLTINPSFKAAFFLVNFYLIISGQAMIKRSPSLLQASATAGNVNMPVGGGVPFIEREIERLFHNIQVQ